MIREYYIKEFIWKLNGGASDDELLAIFFQRVMEYITRPYYDVNTDESFTSATLKSVLVSHKVPEKDLKLKANCLYVKLSNISLRLETRKNWKTTSIWFTVPFLSKNNMSVMCEPENVYKFLMKANDSVSGIYAEFETLKQKVEKELKKPISEYRLELEKKAKSRAVSVASVEAMAKQKFEFLGAGCVWFDHKVNLSHVFVQFMGGKQQLDITVKYKNLKSAVEVMDKAAQIIRQIDDAGIVVRGVTRMRRLHGILWV